MQNLVTKKCQHNHIHTLYPNTVNIKIRRKVFIVLTGSKLTDFSFLNNSIQSGANCRAWLSWCDNHLGLSLHLGKHHHRKSNVSLNTKKIYLIMIWDINYQLLNFFSLIWLLTPFLSPQFGHLETHSYKCSISWQQITY